MSLSKILALTACLLMEAKALHAGKLTIAIDFPDESLSPSGRKVFKQAANRWSSMIEGSPWVREDYTLRIEASAQSLDGPGKVLGQARPTTFWNSTTPIPTRGTMTFDADDMDNMFHKGTLLPVITHEMAHVLGLGTTWDYLIRTDEPNGPYFTGEFATREYGQLLGKTEGYLVPVANTGSAGTYGSHWREDVFGNELMTGYVNSASDPISRVTLGAFVDLGYAVYLDKADEYTLPTSSERVLIRQMQKRKTRLLWNAALTESGVKKCMLFDSPLVYEGCPCCIS